MGCDAEAVAVAVAVAAAVALWRDCLKRGFQAGIIIMKFGLACPRRAGG